MRIFRITNRRAAGIAASALTALAWDCGEKRPEERPSSAPSAARPVQADTLWYDRARLLDVDGDGAPDSVRLYAEGAVPDSMKIRLVVRSNGETRLEESWRGSYVLVDPPANVRTPEERARHLRARLDRTLAAVRLKAFDARLFEAPWERYCLESPHACISLELKRAASTVDWEKVPQGEYGEAWERLEATPVDSAEVRAIVKGLRERAFPNLELAYGYETHKLLAWDPARRRFWTLTSCC